jgi:AraC family transcriptional regulator
MQRPAVADYPPGVQMPQRVLDDFELVWMLHGRARLTSEHDDLPLRPGQLLLLPPGLRHGFTWDRTRGCRHGYVHFGPEHVEGRLSPEVRVRELTADDPLAGLCAYLLWLGRSEPEGWPGRGDDTLRLLLRLFLEGPLPEADRAPVLAPPLAAAVEHLRRVWSRAPLRRVGVGELAAVTHVSRGYVNRLFRAGFGLSAAAALERARCSRAETLLARTDLSIEAVARRCGFADASHFSHRFRAIYGVSPRAYRTGGTLSPSVLDHPGVRRLSHVIWG